MNLLFISGCHLTVTLPRLHELYDANWTLFRYTKWGVWHYICVNTTEAVIQQPSIVTHVKDKKHGLSVHWFMMSPDVISADIHPPTQGCIQNLFLRWQ